MNDSSQAQPVREPNIAEEISRIPYETLLPIEKKLIVGSLVLGVVLLGVLLWISNAFFAGPVAGR
jgi:hypothetical protein